jgi:hypothetical protein
MCPCSTTERQEVPKARQNGFAFLDGEHGAVSPFNDANVRDAEATAVFQVVIISAFDRVKGYAPTFVFEFDTPPTRTCIGSHREAAQGRHVREVKAKPSAACEIARIDDIQYAFDWIR